jgi:hypothetical protein
MGELAHRAKRVAEMVLPASRTVLADAAEAVEVGVRSVREHLGQAGLQVEGVGRGLTVGGLLQVVTSRSTLSAAKGRPL